LQERGILQERAEADEPPTRKIALRRSLITAQRSAARVNMSGMMALCQETARSKRTNARGSGGGGASGPKRPAAGAPSQQQQKKVASAPAHTLPQTAVVGEDGRARCAWRLGVHGAAPHAAAAHAAVMSSGGFPHRLNHRAVLIAVATAESACRFLPLPQLPFFDSHQRVRDQRPPRAVEPQAAGTESAAPPSVAAHL